LQDLQNALPLEFYITFVKKVLEKYHKDFQELNNKKSILELVVDCLFTDVSGKKYQVI